MTKYIAFKIFDTKHYDNFDAIKDKQLKKNYAIVHEDYFEGIIREHLKDD